MLTTILSSIGPALIDAFLGKALEAFKAYNDKQISMEELRTRLNEALLTAAKDVQVTMAQEMTKSYAAFLEAATKSKIMQRVWAVTAISQLWVLFWYQFIVPVMATWGLFGISKTHPFASPGTTIDWAYALLLFCLGGGALALQSGPNATTFVEKLKSLVR